GATEVRAWDLATGKAVVTEGRGEVVAFSPDGLQFALAEGARGVSVGAAAPGAQRRLIRGASGAETYQALAFSGDGRLVAAAGTNRLNELGLLPHGAEVFAVASGRSLYAGHGHEGAVLALAFGPARPGRSPLLATAGADRTVRVWDPEPSPGPAGAPEMRVSRRALFTLPRPTPPGPRPAL